MLKIDDDRSSKDKLLRKLELDEIFLWRDEYVCRRVSVDKGVDIRCDGIPVIFMGTSEITCMDPDTWVEPIKCKLMIVDDSEV